MSIVATLASSKGNLPVTDIAAPRVRPGIELLPLDTGAVLFCERSQNIYGLNGAAALCWAALEEGLGAAEAADALVAAGAPAAEAPVWYRRALDMFRLRGLVEGGEPPPPPPPGVQAFGSVVLGRAALPTAQSLFLRAFDAVIELRLAEPDIEGLVRPMFCRLVLERAAPPDLVFGVGRWEGGFVVTRGEDILARADSVPDFATEVEQAVLRSSVDRTDYLLSLHCGAMERHGTGMLLAAASGSGKTTLCAGLMHRGWGYGSDEMALLSRGTLRARAAPVGLCIKEGSWPVLEPLFPDLAAAAEHGRYGRRVRYLAPRNPVAPDLTVRQVVFPMFRRGGATSLRALPRPEGLQQLFGTCISIPRRLTRADVAALVDWSGGVSFHALEMGDLAASVAALEELASDQPG